MKMITRNLDGIYTRVLRDGKYVSVCFTDLEREEQEKFLSHLNDEQKNQLCYVLADALRGIAEEYNIFRK